LRALGWTGENALNGARTNVAFLDLVERGLAREVWQPELESYDFCDSDDAVYRKRINERIDRDGYWFISIEIRTHSGAHWEHAVSCGGFVGQDYNDSGCDVDLRSEALEFFEAACEKEAETVASRATYAG
jgi:hypothetical protein